MNKPKDFDMAGNNMLEAGVHLVEILNVKEVTSKNGNEMLKVSVDISDTDKQGGYFRRQYNNTVKSFPGAKWSNNATKYIMCFNRAGQTNYHFKKFVDYCAEGGRVAEWGDNFCKSLKGAVIPAIFIEEEYLKDGEIKTFVRLDNFISISKWEQLQKSNYKPEIKRLPEEYRPESDLEPVVDADNDEDKLW